MDIREYTASEPLKRTAGEAFNDSLERAPGRETDTILSIVGDDHEFGRQIDDLLDGKRKVQGYPANTYPFGEPTDQIYPQMLAVYKGERKAAGWKDLLEKTLSYAKAERKSDGQERRIIILTDSWNPDMMKKLEDMLLDTYFQGNLSIHVFLYTYCGFTNIPMITNHRWQGEIPKKTDIAGVVRKLAGRPILFSVFPSTWEQNKLPKEYEIRIFNRNEAVIRERHSDRRLYAGKKEIDRLAAVIGTLPEDPGNCRRQPVLDGASCHISMPGIPEHITDFYDECTWEQLVSAFKDLIDGAKEEKDA